MRYRPAVIPARCSTDRPDLAAAVAPVIESLEERRLLAVSLVAGVVTWTGTAADDKFVALVKGTNLVVTDAGTAHTFPLSTVLGVAADGGAGNDRILINQERTKFLLRTTLVGGDGDDTIVGGNGRDAIHGGAGSDWLEGNGGKDNLRGGDDADTLVGGAADDKLSGDLGDDSLSGGVGNDVLLGGAGNDRMGGDDGNDSLGGEDGDDAAAGGAGNDTIEGAAGADTIGGDAGKDKISGNAGDDKLQGGKGDDRIFGGAGLDRIYGRTSKVSDDDGWSGEGIDNDEIYGGPDGDVIVGGPGDDLILGEAGDDQIFGGTGWDDLSGGDGNDTIHGEDGEDFIFGDAGLDLLRGGDDVDEIVGGPDADVLFGEAGDDVLRGGGGGDFLSGDAGNDSLDGESGVDTVIGGEGADGFAPRAEDFTDRNETDPGGHANTAPSVASLSANPNPVMIGEPVTLSANEVTDPVGTVLVVRFYRETNGVPGLQTGPEGDLLLASDVNPYDGWSTVIDTNGIGPGEHTFHAQATDNCLAVSSVVSTVLTMQMPVIEPPVIGSVIEPPEQVELGVVDLQDPAEPLGLYERSRRERAGSRRRTIITP